MKQRKEETIMKARGIFQGGRASGHNVGKFIFGGRGVIKVYVYQIIK
jgi:hypothetical protein